MVALCAIGGTDKTPDSIHNYVLQLVGRRCLFRQVQYRYCRTGGRAPTV